MKAPMTKYAAMISSVSVLALAAAPLLAQQKPVPSKPATAATKAANAAVLKALPFGDKEDFANATRGLISRLCSTSLDAYAPWEHGVTDPLSLARKKNAKRPAKHYHAVASAEPRFGRRLSTSDGKSFSTPGWRQAS